MALFPVVTSSQIRPMAQSQTNLWNLIKMQQHEGVVKLAFTTMQQHESEVNGTNLADIATVGFQISTKGITLLLDPGS